MRVQSSVSKDCSSSLKIVVSMMIHGSKTWKEILVDPVDCVFVSIWKNFWVKLLVGLIIGKVMLLLLHRINFYHRKLDFFHFITLVPSIRLLLGNFVLLELFRSLLLIVTLVCILTWRIFCSISIWLRYIDQVKGVFNSSNWRSHFGCVCCSPCLMAEVHLRHHFLNL